MKKKGTILAGLLLATIVTGYSVAGTYAKYVSAIDVTDSARVAKWNIDLANDATLQSFSLFDKDYTDARADEKIVAPGTSGKYEFTLAANNSETTNDTEVDYKFSFDVIDEDIKGEDGTTVVTPKTDNTVVTASGYSPLRFRLGVKGAYDTDTVAYTYYSALNTNKGWLTFDELKAALEDDTNTTFTEDKKFVIEWYWFFDEADAISITGLDAAGLTAAGIVTDDAKDTELGKAAATGTAPRVTISVKVVAEQTNGNGTNN